jgi:hypothetical protein
MSLDFAEHRLMHRKHLTAFTMRYSLLSHVIYRPQMVLKSQ